jgi:hypothetical protein
MTSTPNPASTRPVPPAPTHLALDHAIWSAWMENSDSWDGVGLYATEETALARAAADYASDEYGNPDPDEPIETGLDLVWARRYGRWQLLDAGRDTGVRVADVAVYRPATTQEAVEQDAERARREAEYAALPRMSMAAALEALTIPAPSEETV